MSEVMTYAEFVQSRIDDLTRQISYMRDSYDRDAAIWLREDYQEQLAELND